MTPKTPKSVLPLHRCYKTLVTLWLEKNPSKKDFVVEIRYLLVGSLRVYEKWRGT